MSILDFGKRSQIRDGLAMTLAKTKTEEESFLQCFDRFFKSELPNLNKDSISDDIISIQNLPSLNVENDLNEIEKENVKSKFYNELIKMPLIQQLMTSNRTELALSMRRAAQEVNLSEIKLFTQKGQYTRKMLDAMGEEHIRNAVGTMEKFDDQNLNEIKNYRDLLRQEVRNYVEREYMLQAEGRNKQLSKEILLDVRLGNIERYYLNQVQDLIKKMASKLSKRYGRQVK